MTGKVGRPPKIIEDEKTLATIRGLGRIQSTTREAAAVLGISVQTFHTFLNAHPAAREAFDDGAEEGKASLRRTQFKLAENNAAMAIFLGKNLLGQSDKVQNEHSGPDGKPIEIEHSVAEEKARKIAEIFKAGLAK